jgi:hypothetical protein
MGVKDKVKENGSPKTPNWPRASHVAEVPMTGTSRWTVTVRTQYSVSSPMPIELPFNVYQDQLTSLFHGIPLWNPPPKHFYNNVSIGDVGFLQEGTFIRMFNVMLPWEDPSNQKFGNLEIYESLDCGPLANTIEAQFDRVDHYSRYVSTETHPVQATTPDE